jgi:hypothetical protein
MVKASSPSRLVLLPAAIAQCAHAEMIAAMLNHLREIAAGELGIPLEKIVVEIKLGEPQQVRPGGG